MAKRFKSFFLWSLWSQDKTPSITTGFHYANKSNLFSFESKKRNLIAYSFSVLFIRNGMVYHIEYELMSLWSTKGKLTSAWMNCGGQKTQNTKCVRMKNK